MSPKLLIFFVNNTLFFIDHVIIINIKRPRTLYGYNKYNADVKIIYDFLETTVYYDRSTDDSSQKRIRLVNFNHPIE